MVWLFLYCEKYIVKDICEGYIAKIIVKDRKQKTQINTNKYK